MKKEKYHLFKDNYDRKRCAYCKKENDLSACGQVFINDLFINHNIIININHYRYCTQCLQYHNRLLRGRFYQRLQEVNADDPRVYSTLNAILTKNKVRKSLQNNKILKKFEKYSELNYENMIRDKEFLRYTRLNKKQYKKFFEFLYGKIEEKLGTNLGSKDKISIKLSELDQVFQCSVQRKSVWNSVLIYTNACVIGCKWLDMHFYWNLSINTIKKLFWEGLCLCEAFFTPHWTTLYWTPEKIKESVPDDFHIIFGELRLYKSKLDIFKHTHKHKYSLLKENTSVIIDGSDHPISRFTCMDHQSNSWSEKSKFNGLRFMYWVSLNGLIMFVTPKTGFMCTGAHNDANTFDYLVSHNYMNINDKLDPS